jgi:hypothetical protein
MAVALVVLLEMIDVAEDDRERGAAAAMVRPHARQRLFERAPVGDAGQRCDLQEFWKPNSAVPSKILKDE